MSRIRAKDIGPERFVRSMLHQRGYRFRLHLQTHAREHAAKGNAEQVWLIPWDLA